MSLRSWQCVGQLATLGLLLGCGSIVRSTREGSPPPHGSEMKGLAYWLPQGSVIIDGTWDKDAKDCSVKVSTLIEPDTSSRWRMTRKVNHLFEDTVLLEVDPTNGLLKTVNGTSEDKSAEIVATALQAAAKAMTFGAGGGVSTAASKFVGKKKTKPCDKFKFPGSFHFQIPISKLLGANGSYCASLTVGPLPDKATAPTNSDPNSTPTPTPTLTATPTASPTPTPEPINFQVEVKRIEEPDSNGTNQIGKEIEGHTVVDGIVVRAPAPYRLTITRSRKGEDDLSGNQIVFLPDPTRIYYLPLDRTPFVKNETKIALVSGVVQSVSVTRPSIILGIVSVPKQILEALIPVISH